MDFLSLLVPLDFSPASDHLLEYVGVLATKLPFQKIILLHTYEVNHAVLSQPMVMSTEAGVVIDNQHLLEHRRHKLEQRLGNNAPEVKAIQEEGKLANVIKKIVPQESVGLILMGLTGKNAFEQKVIGSNTFAVIQSSPVSVVILPEHAKINTANHKAVVAIDGKEDPSVLKKSYESLFAYFEKLGIKESYFVSINASDETNFEKIHHEIAQSAQNTGTDIHLDFTNVSTTQKTSEAIISQAAVLAPDLLVFIEKQYSAFERFFHSSVIKKTSYLANIPILVLDHE